MRRLRLLASIALSLAMVLTAVPAGAVSSSRIDSVAFFDDNNGWISGGVSPQTGFVSHTSDGGATWHTTTVPLRWFYGVEADGPTSAWAVPVSHDYLYRSTDGGATWTEKGPLLGDPDGAYFRDAIKLGSRIVAFGQHKGATYEAEYRGDTAVIVSSTDGGTTWTEQYQGPYYPPPDEFSSPPTTKAEITSADTTGGGSVAFASGNEWNADSDTTFKRNLIFKTANTGSTWTTALASNAAGWPVTSIAMGSSNVAFAGTESRVTLRTLNGGTTWATASVPRSNTFSVNAPAVDAFGENILVVGGKYGFVGWTSNAKVDWGTTESPYWKYATIAGGPTITSVQVLSPTTAIAIGEGEAIAKTADAGASWTRLPSGPPAAAVTGPAAGFPLTLAPITIQGTASDAGVGVDKVEVRIRRADGRSYNGISWVTEDSWLPAQTSDQWDHWSASWTPDVALLASGQMVTISARSTDGIELTGISTGVSSGAPMSASVSLSGGDPYTTSSPVTASIAANGATHMRWKVDSGSFNAWQSFATTASIGLTAGDGLKTVTFEFSADGANVAASASDTITLHTSVPTASMTSPAAGFGTAGPVSISGTAADAGGSVSAVHVRIRRADGQSWNGSAWVGTDSWLPASTGNGYANWTYNWTPSGVGDQIVTLQARATDAANLTTTTAGVSSIGPVTGSISLDDGAAYTATTSVPAAVSADSVTHMRWRVDGGAYTSWGSYATDSQVTLTSSDGTKTVEFQFSTDGGSTVAGTASDTIVLHTTIPSVGLATPMDGFRLTLAPVSIVGAASDVGLGVSSVDLLIRRADGKSWNGLAWADGDTWLATSTENGYADWTYLWMPGVDATDPGHIVTVFARATDESGLTRTTSGLTSGSAVRASASLAGGDEYSTTSMVEAGVNAETMTHLRYKVSGEPTSTWTAYTSNPSVLLGSVDGSKTVTFEFSADGGDNVGAVAEDSIYLDDTLPSLAVAAPSAGFALSGSSQTTISGTASDGHSGLESVQVRIERGGQYWSDPSWTSSEVWLDADVAGGDWSYVWQKDAQTTSGYLPVTVTMRATDIAGNVTEWSPISSIDPLDPTSVTLTSKSSTLAYGGTGYVKGTFRYLGEPLSGAQVILQSGSSSTSLKDTSLRRTTDANGGFSFSVKPSSKTYYRVRYAATSTRTGSYSLPIYYTPKAYVTTPYAPTSVRRGSSFSSYGYVKPRHTSGTYPVRIYLYRYVKGQYRYYKYVNAKASNYSSYTKYTRSFSLPYAGKWRIRAYHADSGHAATWSSYRYITVK